MYSSINMASGDEEPNNSSVQRNKNEVSQPAAESQGISLSHFLFKNNFKIL